jgi:CHAD domain-containing protein
MTGKQSIRKHAAGQAGKLLRKFASQATRARRKPDPEAVHDLRVSIRRLSQCLRVFQQFFPAGERRRVRRRLKKLMRAAGEVRNRDIALDLLASFGVPADSEVLRRLAGGRARAVGDLAAALDRWRVRDSDWRAQLEL